MRHETHPDVRAKHAFELDLGPWAVVHLHELFLGNRVGWRQLPHALTGAFAVSHAQPHSLDAVGNRVRTAVQPQCQRATDAHARWSALGAATAVGWAGAQDVDLVATAREDHASRRGTIAQAEVERHA